MYNRRDSADAVRSLVAALMIALSLLIVGFGAGLFALFALLSWLLGIMRL